MEKRSNGLMYTHTGDIRAARVNYAGAYGRFDRSHAYQPPSKRVSPYMVTLADGRERRVYVMAYGNSGVPYIIVRGTDVILDAATDDALAHMHASGEPFIPTRPHAELVEIAKSQILDDVADGTIPSTVATYSELHDYVDANMYGGDDLTSAEAGPLQEEIHAWITEGGISAAIESPDGAPMCDDAFIRSMRSKLETARDARGYDADSRRAFDRAQNAFNAARHAHQASQNCTRHH